MRLGGLSGRFFRISEWISRLAYVNFLWLLFTLTGLVLLGIMPATVALFAVIRKWVLGKNEFSVFSVFWKTYRKEFVKSNFLGAVLVIFSFILYVDLAFIPIEGIFFTLIRFGVLVISFLFLIVLLYIFPVYVHYDWKIGMYLKYAFILGASYPHFTFGMMIGIFILYLILTIVPGVIPFFSVSLLAFMIMWTANQVFKKAEGLTVTKTKTESI
ncbi:YesL family protein [Metabacillus arenae]|uniref:YesL family protein n=1 Tax=Metabacillus arenae TaxID=2771434 RepID=A0A926RWQ7_9BACI|nr:YesL family protein [Metabacillus arenae]MBD1379397.1 YesL family protein [Metabacillus arenae]